MATHGDPWRAATPSQTPSSRRKTLSVSPYEGEDLFPEGGRTPGPCVSPLPRGEQEGSCGAGILRFPHRLTDPRGEGEHRSPSPFWPVKKGTPSGLSRKDECTE